MMEITPLGDSALIVRIQGMPKDEPEKALRGVLATMAAIEHARIPGVIECAPAYTTVALFFDPAEAMRSGANPGAITQWLEEKIRQAVDHPGKRRGPKPGERLIEVPICCDREFALDLEQVAAHAGLAEDQVVTLYCAAKYQVGCVGFTPGFPYLAGLPKQLAMPRRSTPRQQIPPGSVAIGGAQAGIYPLLSPGGWNIIGRTPLTLFDPHKDPPALFAPGDRVRFRLIPRSEFERSML
jgi:inhibitor of KinA